MTDLSLVSEEDLWEEMKKRHHAAVLVTLKSYDVNREGIMVSYCGGRYACIGMAQYAMAKMMAEAIGPSSLQGES
jgi:hypothetical protein